MAENLLPFAGEDWVARFHAEINVNAQYALLARKWEGALNLDIVDAPRCIWIDVHHGRCHDSEATKSSDDRDAPFVLSAKLAVWKAICGGELSPVQAMATRRLKVKGDMMQVMKFARATLAMVESAKAVPTDWTK